jgi:hypothetical protein
VTTSKLKAVNSSFSLSANSELQTCLGKKYCDETELLPLLILHGIRTLDITNLSVRGAKVEISRAV